MKEDLKIRHLLLLTTSKGKEGQIADPKITSDPFVGEQLFASHVDSFLSDITIDTINWLSIISNKHIQ